MMDKAAAPPPNRNPAPQRAQYDKPPAATEKRQAFAERLERLERSNADKSSPDRPTQEQSVSAQKRDRNGSGGQQDNGQSTGDDKPTVTIGGDPQATAALRNQKIGFVPISAAAEVPPAHLERMAAAIQELSANGANAEFQINLPLGPTQVETVILGRDAQGRIAVQLMLGAFVPPAVMNQLAGSLAHRLRQRDVRVGDVKFTAYKVTDKHSKG